MSCIYSELYILKSCLDFDIERRSQFQSCFDFDFENHSQFEHRLKAPNLSMLSMIPMIPMLFYDSFHVII